MDVPRNRGRLRRVNPDTIARAGLGTMLLLAGVHKLVAPVVWAAYVVDWLEPLLVVSPVTFMLINGVLEIGFGGLLLLDRYTTVAAGVAMVSLAATVVYLGIVTVTQNGLFLDVLIRDVGLVALATVVFLRSLD